MNRRGNSYWMVLLVCLVSLGISPVCLAGAADDETSIEEVRQEASDLMEALKNYAVEQRDEAASASKAALDRLDERIDTLQTRIDEDWDKMSHAVREETRENLKALRDQRTRVAEWYGSMKASSASAWEEMKQGFSNAYGELTKAWEKAETEFEAEQSQEAS